jgi:hypothetical protein
MRFLASSRGQSLGSPSRRFPHRRRLPSLGFLNPSTVCTPNNLVGLFHPTRTSRLRPPGFFPRSEQIRLFAVSCPLAVTADEPHRFRYDSPATLLQGFDSPRESVASIPQLSSFDARYPPGLSPLQGLLSHGRGFHFGKPPLSSLQGVTYETSACHSSGFSRARESVHLSRGVHPS